MIALNIWSFHCSNNFPKVLIDIIVAIFISVSCEDVFLNTLNRRLIHQSWSKFSKRTFNNAWATFFGINDPSSALLIIEESRSRSLIWHNNRLVANTLNFPKDQQLLIFIDKVKSFLCEQNLKFGLFTRRLNLWIRHVFLRIWVNLVGYLVKLN